MARFSTLFLDLDGTLVDAFTTIHRGYVHTLPQFGLPAPTMSAVRAAVGGGITNAMAHFLPAEQIPAAIKIHNDYTDSILLEDVTLMPGALDLVRAEQARGTRLAVLTNKRGSSARRICAHLGVTPFLHGVFGAGDTAWLKPQPEFTDFALAQIGASRTGTLLIGDSPFDIQTGHNAAFPCWCVTTGTHGEADLLAAQADRVFPDLVTLAKAL